MGPGGSGVRINSVGSGFELQHTFKIDVSLLVLFMLYLKYTDFFINRKK